MIDQRDAVLNDLSKVTGLLRRIATVHDELLMIQADASPISDSVRAELQKALLACDLSCKHMLPILGQAYIDSQ